MENSLTKRIERIKVKLEELIKDNGSFAVKTAISELYYELNF